MRKIKGLFSAILALTLIALLFGCEGGKQISNTNTGISVVSYGEYAQTRVTDPALISGLKTSYWSGDRTTYQNTVYERVTADPALSGTKFSDGAVIEKGETYYFAVKPIEWYVLSADNSASVLLSVCILDAHNFSSNTEEGGFVKEYAGYYPNDWGQSDLRAWLNGQFFDKAFSPLDGAALNTVKVISSYPQSKYSAHAKNIEDTRDKVYCMSYKEATERPFITETSYDALRIATVTDYARARGAWFNTVVNAEEGDRLNGSGSWWLRTVGHETSYAAIVRYTGELGRPQEYVDNKNVGVRPSVSVCYNIK